MNGTAPVSASRRGTPWACLVAALERMPASSTKDARRYFARIEARFDPNHVPYSDETVPADPRHTWVSALLELMIVLSERLRRRAFCAGVAMPALSARQRATARMTAALLRALTKRSFPAPANGASDPCPAFVDAMERYANGELRYVYEVPHRDGAVERYIACEPDSSFHALWAEFALLAIELDAHAEFFRVALPTYVATLQLYVDVYAGGADAQPLGTRGQFDASRRATPAAKRRLRAAFAALPFDEVVARHVALVRRYCTPR